MLKRTFSITNNSFLLVKSEKTFLCVEADKVQSQKCFLSPFLFYHSLPNNYFGSSEKSV